MASILRHVAEAFPPARQGIIQNSHRVISIDTNTSIVLNCALVTGCSLKSYPGRTTVDMFYIPVLLYGLEALDNKSIKINSIDFAYNGVFVKILNIKDKYHILFYQRAPKCLPASCKLDMRTGQSARIRALPALWRQYF